MRIDEMVTRAAKAGEVYRLDHFHDVWNAPTVRRLMGNEVVYPPSPKAIRAIVEFASSANYYPEDASTNETLRARLAEYVGIQDGAAWIALGNGSLEIIDMLYRVFVDEGDDILLPCPEYSPYVRRAQLFGARIIDVIPSADFAYEANDFLRKVTARTKMIIMSRPSNPTGNLVSRALVETLCNTARIVVVDEAYAQFAGETVCDLVEKYPNLIVSRTFSKAMGLAGIRLGFVVANPEVVDYVNRVRVPMNVNLMASVAALAALDDLDYIQQVTRKVVDARDQFTEELERIPGLRAFASAGNSVLLCCEGTKKPASAFHQRLLQEGYSVRLFANARGLPGDVYFRVSVGTPQDMKRIAEVIRLMAASE